MRKMEALSMKLWGAFCVSDAVRILNFIPVTLGVSADGKGVICISGLVFKDSNYFNRDALDERN